MTEKNSIAGKLKPLNDDLDEWAKGSWFARFFVNISRRWALAWRIRRQIVSRPCTWGIGLWPNQEVEDVAKECAEILTLSFGCASANLIPEDSIDLIAALDPTGDLDGAEAVLGIESTFGCTLPDSALSGCTFGDLVDAVRKGSAE